MASAWSNLSPSLSEEEYQQLSRLVHQKAGINLHAGKKELIRSRLVKTVRERDFKNFGEYYQHVIHDNSGDELVRLLDSISTNFTSFFREYKHFEFMADVFLPGLTKVISRNKKKSGVRIWSAGCSTGEEPYSIAMIALIHSKKLVQSDFKILATDLSTKVLSQARTGVYSADQVSGVPNDLLKRFFLKGRRDWTGFYQLREQVRQLVVFRRLNLIDPFPMKRPFDMIFCRNVMIYFDKNTQSLLVSRLHQSLAAGGYLMIGHSEGLTGLKHKFKYIQPTIYQKK